MTRNQKIAQDFGIMCCFIEFGSEVSGDERSDILYKEFIKRTGENISKEELAEILREDIKEREQNTTILLTTNPHITLSDSKEQSEPVAIKVKVNDFKHD